VGLVGIAGVSAMIYGGVHLFRVSQQGASEEGVSDVLSFFLKCHDTPALAGDTDNIVQHAMIHRCMAKQLPPRIVMGFAAGFMILALLCAPCAFKKDKWFGFTMWSTLAIVTIITAVAFVGVYAAPAASTFVNCKNYDANTIGMLTSSQFICVKGENVPHMPTTLKWLCKLCTFAMGSAASIAALLMLFMIKSCRCCDPNAASCCSSTGAAGEHPCLIRRTVHRLRARLCRRQEPALSSSVDRDDGLPSSAPSYYEVHAAAPENESASEDAGHSPASSSQYLRVN